MKIAAMVCGTIVFLVVLSAVVFLIVADNMKKHIKTERERIEAEHERRRANFNAHYEKTTAEIEAMRKSMGIR